MPKDGHCILIGEPENNAFEICEMLANTMDCQFETPVTQITQVYWRETLIKVRIIEVTFLNLINFSASSNVSDRRSQNPIIR